MQTIEFLRTFFNKWLEIHSSFYHIFPYFSKFLKFQISKLKFSIFQKLKFKKYQISNLEITEFQTGTKRSIPQPAKSSPRLLSELYYGKTAFVKDAGRKLPLVQSFLF
jgi:hypothetical protein